MHNKIWSFKFEYLILISTFFTMCDSLTHPSRPILFGGCENMSHFIFLGKRNESIDKLELKKWMKEREWKV